MPVCIGCGDLQKDEARSNIREETVVLVICIQFEVCGISFEACGMFYSLVPGFPKVVWDGLCWYMVVS